VVEVVEEDVLAGPAVAGDAPVKLDVEALDEPTPEELEALSADMIGIDDPVGCTSRRSARSPS